MNQNVVNRRNTESVNLTLQEMEKKLHEGLSVIQLQQGTISMLVERVTALEEKDKLRNNMKLVGLGPSET